MRFLISVFACLTLPAHSAGDAKDDNQAGMKGELAELVRLLHSGGIHRVEIIYFPEGILTRTRLTSEMLEKQWRYKVTVSEYQAAPLQKKLLAALEGSEFDKTKQEADLRWGCSFYDDKNGRVLSLYFSADGKAGMVNSKSFLSNGRFVRFLREICQGFRG